MGCKFAKPATLRQPYWRTTKLENLSRLGKDALTKLQSWPPPVRLGFVLLLLVLVGMLTACAAPSVPSSVIPRNPEPPPTTLSERSQTYSEAASESIKAWQKKLTELLPK
jgi:hypothetical protein